MRMLDFLDSTFDKANEKLSKARDNEPNIFTSKAINVAQNIIDNAEDITGVTEKRWKKIHGKNSSYFK